MKAAALVLALLTTTVQTVGWVDCCCILICKHQNDPCKKDCKDKPKAAAPEHADCCKKKAPAAPAHDEKRCSHVEPSSQVISQTAALPAVDLVLVLELPAVPALPVPAGVPDAEAAGIETRGSPPLLHLQYSVFLI